MVRAVPLLWVGTFCATNVENIGESAVTTTPQNIINASIIIENGCKNIKGDKMQQMPDKESDRRAIWIGRNLSESIPPTAQDMPPIAMMTKDHNDRSKLS